jgi:Right handed beta helix region
MRSPPSIFEPWRKHRNVVRRERSAVVFVLWLCCLPAAAIVLHATPADYRAKVHALTPGDELVLEPGEYRQGLDLYQTTGTRDQPIVIRGPARGAVARFVAQPGRNTVSLVDASFVTISDLTLDGRDLPVDALKAEGHAQFSHHIVVDNLVIVGHGSDQGIVGISTKCPAWNWIIRNITIVGAGTGIYLGNSDGSAPFVAGMIEHNTIVDSLGYDLQIKHQRARPDLPGLPRETSMTVIRHNVFAKAHHGARGDSARPNVLVGHWPPAGPGADDRYLVYGNFFYQNPREALFQGEGRIALYSNIFVNDSGDGIHIQPHNDEVKDLAIFFNTVITAGAGLTIRKNLFAARPHLVIRGNALFSDRVPTDYPLEDNFFAPYTQASRYLRAPQGPVDQLEFTPVSDFPHSVERLSTPPMPFTEMALDFCGRRRTQDALLGALAFRDPNRDCLRRLRSALERAQ